MARLNCSICDRPISSQQQRMKLTHAHDTYNRNATVRATLCVSCGKQVEDAIRFFKARRVMEPKA